MNNLIICDIPWFSGLSHYAIEVGQYLIKNGETVYWATAPDSDLWTRLKTEQFRLIPIKGRSSKYFFKNMNLIKNHVENYPDRIICFTGSGLSLGYFLKRRYKALLYRFRTEAQGVRNTFFNRKVYKACDFVIAGNTKIASEIKLLGIEKVRVIYAGVDLPEFSGLSLPQKTSLGFLGRLDHVKGIDTLWESMNKVWETYPDLQLHIAGREVNFSWSDIQDNFSGPVKYWGYLPRSEISGFIQESSIGIISSNSSEATSRVLLEWWASKRPVISTQVGILPELITPNETGILVPPGDVSNLANAILTMVKDHGSIEKMGSAGFQKVKDELSKEVFNKKLSEIF